MNTFHSPAALNASSRWGRRSPESPGRSQLAKPRHSFFLFLAQDKLDHSRVFSALDSQIEAVPSPPKQEFRQNPSDALSQRKFIHLHDLVSGLNSRLGRRTS